MGVSVQGHETEALLACHAEVLPPGGFELKGGVAGGDPGSVNLLDGGVMMLLEGNNANHLAIRPRDPQGAETVRARSKVARA